MNGRSLISAALILPALLCSSHLNSQILFRIGPENADCNHAIELIDTLYGPTTAPVGYGEVMEISSHKNDLFAFEQEHHTVWYLFEAMDYCDLLLEIIPLSLKDDYDFILYRYEGEQTCRLIREKQLNPVRTCISRNDTAQGSRTGLSYSAKDEYIHSGPGPSFARPLPVKAGEKYLLVVDNVYPDGLGHHVRLMYRNCQEPHVQPVEPPSNYLNINIRDGKSLKPVPAQILLVNKAALQPDQSHLEWKDTASLFIKLDRQSQYQLVVKASGYFQFTDQVKTGADYQTYLKTVNLNKIEEGKKVSFNNILFVGGSDQFLRESYPVLDDIIQTLQDQQGIEIQIIGHVNEPYNSRSGLSSAQNQTLSEKRALAVYQYLIRKGIASSRLSWIGKGNSEMIYPYATTEEQMQANRRVELYIKKSGDE